MFPRKSPKELGLDEKIISELVDSLQENKCHSFVIVHDGNVISEGWWDPYSPDLTHIMYSVTKSFTSTAIGMAIDDGLLLVDDYVLSFFKDELPSPPCENMQKLKVKHLLTMSVGHEEEIVLGWDPTAYQPINRGLDINHIQRFLTSYIPLEPGTSFVYNTPATFMLGAILYQVTGKNVVDFLQPRLFEPLGLENVYAEKNSKGLNAAGFGFQLKTEDLAKFGWLLLNKGKWNGKQLVSEKWVDEATTKQIETAAEGRPGQWANGYCYQYWRCSDGKSFRADGLWGQFSIVSPHFNTVVAITSGSETTQVLLDSVLDSLAKLFESKPSSGLENNVNNLEISSLEDKLKNLQIPLPSGDSLSAYTLPYKGKYRIADNMLGITHITIDLQAKTFVVGKKDKEAIINIGEGKWEKSHNGEDLIGLSDFFGDTACSGVVANGELLLQIIHLKAPHVDTFKFKTTENTLVGSYLRSPARKVAECELIGIKD